MSDTGRMRIGAQLYTVRESCDTLEGFAETLKRVACLEAKLRIKR